MIPSSTLPGASPAARICWGIKLVAVMPVLLEVNTTPGMTATSFIPQQIRAAGLAPGKVLEGIIDFLYHRSRR